MYESIAAGVSSDLISSSDSEDRLAQQLERYARALEAADLKQAEQLLNENPELVEKASVHLESLRMLCQSSQPIPFHEKDAFNPGSDTGEAVFSTLGDYQIHREVGRGGMGIVYEATQLSLQRVVAVKVLPFAAVLDQRQINRFRNEAHAAASLHHPHIVPVYGVGCERGVHYYSMQMINGQSLEQSRERLQSDELALRLERLRQANAGESQGNTETQSEAVHAGFDVSLPAKEPRLANASTQVNRYSSSTTCVSKFDRNFIRDTVQLIICVAEALEYAHGEGVIHRDIKPSNLLVDQQGKIWIADFGLARCRGMGNLTAEGTLMGTIRYMSPEQMAARACEIDHRTDIYSLGITLYELLTSQPAFQAANREQLMRAVEFEQAVSPRRLNPLISSDLETILLKSIAKDKGDRYDTAGEFADDLRRFLGGLPTLARRPTATDRVFKWVVRRRGTVIASLAVLVLLVAGLVASTITISRHSYQTEIANQRARYHLHQAHSVVDRFGRLATNRLSGSPISQAVRRDLLLEAESYYLDFIRYAQSDRHLRRELASVRYRLGAVLSDLGETEASDTSYQHAIQLFLSLRDASPRDAALIAELAMCFHNSAKLNKDVGRISEAVRSYRQAASYQEEAMRLAEDDADLASQWSATQTNLASLLFECGQVNDASERLIQVLQRLDDIIAKQPQNRMAIGQRVESRNALVAILMGKDSEQAASLLRMSIRELESESDHDTVGREECSLSKVCQLAIARSNLATLLGKDGRSTEAVELTTLAIRELESALTLYPGDSATLQQLAIALNNHGQLKYSRGDSAAAEASFSKSEKTFRQVVSSHPVLPQPKSRLAGVLHNQSVLDQAHGRGAKALQQLSEAIKLQTSAIQSSPFNPSYREYLRVHHELMDEVSALMPGGPKDQIRNQTASTKELAESKNVQN